MQCVFDFVEGNLPVEDFMEAYLADEAVQSFLQDLMNRTYFNSAGNGNTGIGMQSLMYSGRSHFYNVKAMLEAVVKSHGQRTGDLSLSGACSHKGLSGRL